MAESLVTTQQSSPNCTGLRYLFEDPHIPELLDAMMLHYSYNGSQCRVVACTKDAPWGKGLGQSDEGKILDELNELSYGEQSEEKNIRIEALEKKLAGLVGDVCFPLMRQLAPLSITNPKTLQERIYPPTFDLRVFTEDGKPTPRELVNFEYPGNCPPIPEAKLQEIGLDDTLPVFSPSQIILGPRLQGLIWKVTIDGEDMICKVATSAFWNCISEELETYWKIRKSEIINGLRVPELKGIIRSHTGVIGILLGNIPHKHHNLRVLLKLIAEGAVPETEATASLKQKWAEQIRHSLAQLHKLGILWRDVKTDDVLIDENDDAVLLDFGGGNTVGWVDHDKYGTMEGDQQGLQKIMKALGQA